LEQIRQSPELALNLLGSMSRHLRRLVRQVEQLTNRSSLERLADFLLRLCPHGEPRAEIELPLDKVLVAARLGMQPETLYRSLARLRDAGVETRGSQIVVNDVARLGRLAHGRRAS
jgi:CRP/FNR family transcriptional regulator, dissimilatory nitrate respiration regulator